MPIYQSTGNPLITAGPSFTFGGGSSVAPQSMPGATAGSTVSNYGSTTTPVSGPNGPFSSLQAPLQTGASTLAGYGNTILNTAFDPQSQLYNQQLQKEKDQTNVNEAQRGLTMSPYGAGVANQADTNFNINWQNAQLGRQLQGIQGASSALAPATNLYNSQYGSSTSGYNTSPPVPQQNTATRTVSSPTTSSPSVLPYPNMTPPTSYQYPVNSTVPTTSSYGQTPYSQLTGAPTDTSTALTQMGVDNQSMGIAGNGPTYQQQMNTPEFLASITGQDTSSQGYTDTQGTTPAYQGGPTVDQLIADTTAPQNDYSLSVDPSDPLNYNSIMNVNSDAAATNYLSDPSVLQYFN